MQINNDSQSAKNRMPAQAEPQSTVTQGPSPATTVNQTATPGPSPTTTVNQTATPQQSNPQDISEEKKQKDLELLLQQKQNKFLSNEAREKATTLPMSKISNPFRDTDK